MWQALLLQRPGMIQRKTASKVSDTLPVNARCFDGDALKMRRASVEEVARSLNVRANDWKEAERNAFEDLALVLALIPDLADWTKDERLDVVRIVRAKASADEARYVRLLQRHPRLRDEVIKLGS